MPSPTSPCSVSQLHSPTVPGGLRREMAEWAEPVISDRITDAYDDCGLSAPAVSLLTIHHRRLWRALILDQRAVAERTWIELERDLLRAGLDPAVADEIDALVLDELMNIIFARFRASRDKARVFGRVLLGAAAQIRAVRPVAA